MIRNIYADHDADLVVRVPAGEFLAQQTFDLPDRALLYANTGIGKTTYALDLDGQTVFVTSTTPAVEQVLQRRPDAHAWYQQRKDATADSRLIVTTYESFASVLRFIDASRFNLVVDEAHNLAASTARNYRRRSLRSVADTLAGSWRRVLLMTGTPARLSHPYLANYQVVSVESDIRQQQAQRVVWKSDDNPRGRLRDALLDRLDVDRRHLVFYQDKRTGLDKLVAGLLARGFSREQIAILNSDNKLEDASQRMIQSERVSDDVRVLVTTSVFVEAVNMRSQFDAAHLVSSTAPALAQQFVNRLRVAPAGIVYWYNIGAGGYHDVSVDLLERHFVDEAERELAHRQRAADPDDTSEAAVVSRRMVRRYQTTDLVREDEDEDGATTYGVDWLAVAHEVFQAQAAFCVDNPQAFKTATQRYGWTWAGDVVVVSSQTPAATKQRQDAISDELRDLRQQAHEERVETVRDAGPRGSQLLAADSATDGATLRTVEQVGELRDALLEDTNRTDAQQVEAHALACDLVLDAGDSQTAINRKVRQIRIQRDRLLDREPFAKRVYGAFQVGDVVTSEDVHERFVDAYQSDAALRWYAEDRLALPWSREKTPRLTKTKATRLLRELFETKRTKTTTADGRRVNAWRIVDTQPLPASVSLFLSSFLVKHAKSETAPAVKPTPASVRIIDVDSAEPSTVRQLGPEDALVLVNY